MNCIITPTGPCKLCKDKKIKCSLMPKNPKTGKADRRLITREEALEYCLKQVEELHAKIIKGKQCAGSSPGTGEPSGSVPSPLKPLVSLNLLTLDSRSSATITPADSLVTGAQPPLPEPPTAASQSAPKTGKASNTGKYSSKSPFSALTQNSTGPMAGSSRLLKPVCRQASCSSSDASPLSNAGSNSDRIAALESEVERLKQWAAGVDEKLKELGLYVTLCGAFSQ